MSLRRGASVLAVAALSAVSLLATAGATAAAGSPPSAPAAPTAATAGVADGVATYATQVAGVFTQSTTAQYGAPSGKAQASPTPSVAVSETTPIADAVRLGGDIVTGAKVASRILSTSTDASGTVTVMAELTTTLTIQDDGLGNPTLSSWTDTHRIKLVRSGSTYVVVADVNLPAPAENAPIAQAGPAKPHTGQPENQALKVASDVPVPSSASLPANSSSGTMQRSNLAAATTLAATAGYPTETAITPSSFAAYAIKWTSSPNDGNEKANFNSTYPFYSNNCANFASQVLDTGGWYLTGGNSLQVSDSTKWTYNLAGIAGASRTWSQASSLYTFANNTGTYGWLDNIWNARTGDLLFVDWDPNGKADGSIDHVMVVSGYTSTGDPRISQKSNNRSNINLHTSIALAADQGKTSIVWYGLKHK